MSDVRFHNLTYVPLQEEFTPPTVIKILTASKCFAAVIGIISICVFTLTDNAKTAITTIQATNSIGNCVMISAFTGNTDDNSKRLTATQASDFFEGYKKLLKDVTGAADVNLLIDSTYSDLFVSRTAPPSSYQQVYFEHYQNCIDAFSEPVVCNYVQLGTGQDFDQPLPISDRRGRGFCQSSLNCAWPCDDLRLKEDFSLTRDCDSVPSVTHVTRTGIFFHFFSLSDSLAQSVAGV